jgi:copper chaperone CopZ
MSSETVTLKVSGMTCMGCVGSVRRILGQLPGVDTVEVDLASGNVRISYDQALVPLATLKQSIVDGGYQVLD